jgi:hypothetical protein
VRVGLIVNPNASRDVRRLTTLARTVGVYERTNVVARILHGMAGAGAGEILYMPEPAGIVEGAARLAFPGAEPAPGLVAATAAAASDAAGTAAAAAAMAAAGVGCIVTVGGDGTNRAVAAGWPEAVLVPLPGGTNNAFSVAVDPTAGGLAAGLYAGAPHEYAAHARREPLLEASLDGVVATAALVDVSLVRSGWTGTHAILEAGLLAEAVIARSDPALPGLCGIGGSLRPLARSGRGAALYLRFGRPGRTVLAPLGPGRLVPLSVSDCRVLEPGDAVELGTGRNGGAATLAFDGERELVLEPGSRPVVRVTGEGPRVLDAAALLRQAAESGRLVLDGHGGHCA